MRRLLGLLALVLIVPSASAATGAWYREPSDISPSGRDAFVPQVATGKGGLTIAVWIGFDGANDVIQAAAGLDGRAWKPPVTLSAAGRNASAPQVAVAADGSAVAVWARSNGTDTVIQAATRSAAGVWGAPQTLSAGGQNAETPTVATAPDGTATAVWDRFDGSTYIAQVSSRRPGHAWSSPHNLSATGLTATAEEVAVAPDGRVTAAWVEIDAGQYTVQAAVGSPGGPWSTPKDLSAPGQAGLGPRVAVAPDGTATVVWYRSDGANLVIQAASHPVGGAWSSPQTISQSGRDSQGPRLAVAPNGTATAVWWRFDGANQVIQTASRPEGGAWSPPATLSGPGEDGLFPVVAVAPDGTATAIWERSDGAHYIAQAASRPAGGAWSAPADLSLPGADANGPRVAVAPDGTAVAVWVRSDPVNLMVQAASTSVNVPPVLRSAPRIKGKARIGKKLTCSPGSWLYATRESIAWLRNGRAIRHATKLRYRVTARDRLTVLTCRVTARGPGGATTAYSLGVAPR
jgi:hypothetical protein